MKRFLRLFLLFLFLALPACVPEGSDDNTGETFLPLSETCAVQYCCRHINMTLNLPAGWEYEFQEPNGGSGPLAGSEPAGIHFWPAESPDFLCRLSYYPQGTGYCGMGVTVEEVTFTNGLTATKCTEELEDTLWLLLLYRDLPDSCALEAYLPKELLPRYESQLLQILESIRLEAPSEDLSSQSSQPLCIPPAVKGSMAVKRSMAVKGFMAAQQSSRQ